MPQQISASPTLESGERNPSSGPRRSRITKRRQRIGRPGLALLHHAKHHPQLLRALRLYRKISHSHVGDAVGNEQVCQFQDGDTVSQAFERICEELESSHEGLRLFVVSASAENIMRAFSFPYKASLTILYRYEGAARVFRHLIEALLCAHWASNYFEKRVLQHLLRTPQPSDPVPERLFPPMKDFRLPKPQPVSALDTITLPLTFRPDSWGELSYLEWQWPREPTRYEGDIGVYLHQPLKRRMSETTFVSCSSSALDLLNRNL